MSGVKQRFLYLPMLRGRREKMRIFSSSLSPRKSSRESATSCAEGRRGAEGGEEVGVSFPISRRRPDSVVEKRPILNDGTVARNMYYEGRAGVKARGS